MSARRVLVTLIVAMSLLAGGPWVARARPQSNAALDVDLPDPELLLAGDDVYAYSTNATTTLGFLNVPVRRFDAATGWHLLGDALPAVGSWTSPGFVWAPGVIAVDPTVLLFYASLDRRSGRQCIGVAEAPRPSGPFVDRRNTPLVCQRDLGGSIDPSPFRGPDGSLWLTWKSDGNARGLTTVLWSAKLTADGRALASTPTALLQSGAAWEDGIIENPEFVAASGVTWLLYSGGRWESEGYGIGWARCASPAGPCTKGSATAPWIGRRHGLAGPGGASAIVDAATLQMAFHSWTPRTGYASGGRRALHTESIGFTSVGPILRPDLRTIGRPDRRRVWDRGNLLGVGDTIRYGSRGDLLACDFSGTGTDAPTTFDGGWWLRSDVPASATAAAFSFGRQGDQPLCGDFDGDGRDEPAVFRQGAFHLRGIGAVAYGRAGDHGVVGDFDGDGIDDLGIVRSNRFHLRTDRRPGNATISFALGRPADIAVVGDWDGDGLADAGVRRGADFHLQLGLRQGAPVVTVRLGTPGADPVIGDWDGIAGDDLAAVRP